MSGSRAPYLSVADDLIGRVASGDLSPGERLPSIAALAQHYGVAPGTVRSALNVLREQSLIVTRRGTGTFLREDLDAARLAEVVAGNGGVVGNDLSEVLRLLHEVLDRIAALEERCGRPSSECVQ